MGRPVHLSNIYELNTLIIYWGPCMHGSAGSNSIAVGHAWTHGQSWKLCMHACSLINMCSSGLLKSNVQNKKYLFHGRAPLIIVKMSQHRRTCTDHPCVYAFFYCLYIYQRDVCCLYICLIISARDRLISWYLMIMWLTCSMHDFVWHLIRVLWPAVFYFSISKES